MRHACILQPISMRHACILQPISMRHICLLCLILLETVLSTSATLFHLRQDYQTHLGSQARHGVKRSLNYVPGQQSTGTRVSSLMSALSESRRVTLHPNLNLYSPGNTRPLLNRRLIRLHTWSPGTLSSHDRSSPAVVDRHTYVYWNKGFQGRPAFRKLSPPIAQVMDVEFARPPSVAITGSSLKSRHHECRLGQGDALGALGCVVRQTHPPSRMKRRETREVAANAWGDELNSVLSTLGLGSGNEMYNNINTLLGQLAADGGQMPPFSRDLYADDPQVPQTDVGHKVTPDVAKATPHGRGTRDQELQPSISDYVGNTGLSYLSPTTRSGHSYYVLEDIGEMNKRGQGRKENMFALIRQGPRQSQSVALQDLPRASSSLRTHGKTGRIQQQAQSSSTGSSATGTSATGRVCAAESDGTTPMRCPSSPATCLYDSMMCDGKPDCAQAEDESFALCVLRHWQRDRGSDKDDGLDKDVE